MSRFCRSLPFLLIGPLVFLLASSAFLSVARGRTEQLAATYTHGNLSVTIPYHSSRSGRGRLVAEIVQRWAGALLPVRWPRRPGRNWGFRNL